MKKTKAENYIQNKFSIIENAFDCVKIATDILMNSDECSNEELEESLINNVGQFFNVSDMVKEWSDNARFVYISMQITVNKDLVSIAMTNANIFVILFVEKFFK